MKQFWAKKNEHWAIVPCPATREHVIQSANVHGEIPAFSALQVAEYAASFPAMETVKFEERSEVRFAGEIRDDRGRISIDMILQDDKEFGGFNFHGKFEVGLLLEFWKHLLREFAHLRVFDSRDLCLYSVEAFEELHNS